MRYATVDDWPAIESWRAGHFARISPRPVTGQRGLEDAIWIVADRGGVATAAASFQIFENVLHGYDLYGADGHGLDALALGRLLERIADAEGLELRATTDPENDGYLQILLKRGYEVTSIELKRKPRGQNVSI